MKVVGYGICGVGEARRYMRQTLEEFKRLCDETIILVNVSDLARAPEEMELIREYGFKAVPDGREWGVLQWKIKQDFVEKHIAKVVEKGDMLVCLDMDEVLSKKCTKEWIMSAPMDAYHVFVVDLWNDPEHYKPKSSFWNVRLWRWNGETTWKQKPVHCGLAPEWCYHYHRFAPFILKHYGLMDEENRLRKVRRYEQYDPKQQHLDPMYYAMLKSDIASPFDEDDLQTKIEKEVATYQQTNPRQAMITKPKTRFAYIKNQNGVVLDIPEKDLKETLMRKGFSFVGWAENNEDELKELFKDEDIAEETIPTPETSEGSYHKDVNESFAPQAELDDAALESMSTDKPVAPKKTTKKK